MEVGLAQPADSTCGSAARFLHGFQEWQRAVKKLDNAPCCPRRLAL